MGLGYAPEMAGGPAAGWTDFLVAAAGAAGALVGLVFVALSINLARILELPGVSRRAAETIIVLAGALLCALVALLPEQTPARLGLALLAVGIPTWGAPTATQVMMLRARQYQRVGLAVARLALHQAATLPLVLAGLSLEASGDGAMTWLAVGILMSLVVALVNAWVLLVEIMR